MQSFGALAALLAAVVARPGAAARRGGLPPPELRVSFDRHGSDWAQGSCASRNEQSPINLNELYRPIDFSFTYFYANVHSQNVTLRNDGRTISIDVTGQGFGGVGLPHATAPWYNLKRIDLRASSEHTLRGKHAPVEVQLVHQASSIANATEGNQLVTVSILVDCESPPTAKLTWPGFLQKHSRSGRGGGERVDRAEGQAPEQAAYSAPSSDERGFNPTFQVFVENEPPIFDEEAKVSLSASNPWQLGHLLAGGTYFMYKGSETLPPCEERVVWLVRRERVMASNAQVRALFDRLYTASRGNGNYRTIMPLNQRIVRVWSAKEQEPRAIPLKSPYARDVPVSSHDPMRESPAVMWAKDAMTIANAAADHAKDIELRLAAGEEARLGNMEVPLVTEDVVKEVKREVQEAVAESIKQVVPAAANLAKSYLRQELLHAAGLGGPVPSPAHALSPSAAPPLAPAASPALAVPPLSPTAPLGPTASLALAPAPAPPPVGAGGR